MFKNNHLKRCEVIFTFFSILQRCEEDEEIEFYLKFCNHVLFEVLQFGDRCRLTKLEGVGRRFHHLAEKWFGEMPFLRLDIRLKPGPGFVTTIFKICYKSILFVVKDWRPLLVVIGKRFQLLI